MTDIVLFDDDDSHLRPLNLTRPPHLLVYGFRPAIHHIRKHLGQPSSYILPARFQKFYREAGFNVNPEESSLHGDTIFVNASVRPEKEILEKISTIEENRAIVVFGRTVAFRTSRFSYDMLKGISNLREKGIETETFEENMLVNGPWEYVSSLAKGLEGRGVVYGETARVEEPVHFDTAKGPVLIADGAKIEAFSRIEGPALIGRGSVVHSARINSFTYIGENCRVGGEVEHSIISSYSNKSHFGYIGHSYVGEWVNIGAGSVTSDLKNTYGTVKVEVDGSRIDTKMVKLGSFISDYSKVAINASIYAGKKIGSGAHIYGVVERDIPPFISYSKESPKELLLESVIETARRMKKRRNLELGEGEEELIRIAYKETTAERRRMVS
ncbi:MAG: putative sugar nucleotidyl transferase [Conexivisphaerales archaeon]